MPQSEAAALEGDPAWPFILMAGRHTDHERQYPHAGPGLERKAAGPAPRPCIPATSESLGLEDGQMVRVVTEAGRVEVELEVDDTSRPGTVIIPHGFGLVYEGQEQGVNVNRLTRNTHRDPLAGTPLHRYVPCRVEAA